MENLYPFRRLREAGLKNPTVKACLAMFETGSCSLEQALIALAIELAAQNERLSEHAVLQMQSSPGPFIFKK